MLKLYFHTKSVIGSKTTSYTLNFPQITAHISVANSIYLLLYLLEELVHFKRHAMANIMCLSQIKAHVLNRIK